jgi:surfeit locus 1 family protein
LSSHYNPKNANPLSTSLQSVQEACKAHSIFVLARLGYKMKKLWLYRILALILIGILASLGYWQLSRAKQKEILLQSFEKRTAEAPLPTSVLQQKESSDLRFYRTTLSGTFDNKHTFLLDNKTDHGKVGYEVYTSFKANGLATAILVDRGFVPIGKSRKELPSIKPIIGNVSILGMLNLPPNYVAFGQMQESSHLTSPLRIQFVSLSELSTLLGETFFPYILTITPEDPAAYHIQWQNFITMPPERHRGYAVQWFALALTLLILCVALNMS